MAPLNRSPPGSSMSRMWEIVRGLWRLDDDDEDERAQQLSPATPRDEERGELEGYEEEDEDLESFEDVYPEFDTRSRGSSNSLDGNSAQGRMSWQNRESGQLFVVREGIQEFGSGQETQAGTSDPTSLLENTSSGGSSKDHVPSHSGSKHRLRSFGGSHKGSFPPRHSFNASSHMQGKYSHLGGGQGSSRSRQWRRRRRSMEGREGGSTVGLQENPADERGTGEDKSVGLESTMSQTARTQVLRFKRTLQVLGLHAASSSSGPKALSSWVIGFILLLVVPIYAYFFVQPSDDLPQHQLPFQALVLMIQSFLGLNSFIFIISTVKAHGMQGVLFLEAAAHEAPSVQAEYEKCLQQSSGMLWQCLAPLFVLHMVHKCLLYSCIPLKLLPFVPTTHTQTAPSPPLYYPPSSLSQEGTPLADSTLLVSAFSALSYLAAYWVVSLGSSFLSGLQGGKWWEKGGLPREGGGGVQWTVYASAVASFVSVRLGLVSGVFVMTSASWLFSTTMFIFSCVIFWKVCSLQEFKMLVYREQVRYCADPAACFHAYVRITGALGVISKRFRRFLLHSFAITLLGSLASMFQMVHWHGFPLTFTNSGHLVVANFVAIFGTSLCLRSASRLAHNHRRIVRVAATMHAQQTLEGHHATAASMACSSRRWSSFKYEKLIAETRAAAAAASAVDKLLSIARSPSALQSTLQEQQQMANEQQQQQHSKEQQVQQQAALQQDDNTECQVFFPGLGEGGCSNAGGGCRVREGEQQEPKEVHGEDQVWGEGRETWSMGGGGEYLDIIGHLPYRDGGGGSTGRLEQRVILFSRRQDAYMQRAALVEFLSSTSAGISIYGFVLDRFLIHTSFGALLTTTWFILGRSLGGS